MVETPTEFEIGRIEDKNGGENLEVDLGLIRYLMDAAVEDLTVESLIKFFHSWDERTEHWTWEQIKPHLLTDLSQATLAFAPNSKKRDPEKLDRINALIRRITFNEVGK